VWGPDKEFQGQALRKPLQKRKSQQELHLPRVKRHQLRRQRISRQQQAKVAIPVRHQTSKNG
jgi:hypothetical protein